MISEETRKKVIDEGENVIKTWMNKICHRSCTHAGVKYISITPEELVDLIRMIADSITKVDQL
jgi:hypothetical protein